MIVAQKISDTQYEQVRLQSPYKNLPNFDKRDESEWNEHGFYRIEKEPLGTDQKQGQFSDGSLVNNVYVIPAIDMTQAEIDQRAQNELDSDASAISVSQRRMDGEQAYDRFHAEIERMVKDGTIAKQQGLNAWIYFDGFIEALNRGAWPIVQEKMSNVGTVPAGYQNMFTKIQNKVNNYITNNY